MLRFPARAASGAVAAGLAALSAAPSAFAATDASPGAGGAALDQILIASIGALVLTAILLWTGLGHRSGRVKWLQRAADYCEAKSGLVGWSSFPLLFAAGSLITAVFGMYWDIALHIGEGRDEGPLANPAHYFILAGLFGIFSAGYFAIMLPRKRPSSTSVRFLGNNAPLGGVLICACGAFALIGFPLDDVWHRIFGQDVTLWGPTHLMLIGGASMTLVGMAVVAVEGLRAGARTDPPMEPKKWLQIALTMALPGGFLLGLSTFQAEFDFGILQFRIVLEPVMLMLAAGVGLVTVRVWRGPGAALYAVLFFLIIRGILTVLVGPILGQPTPSTAIYIGSAIIVELVALAVGTDRALRFGVIAGALLGTVGLATEWGWTQIAMKVPLNGAMFPEAAIFGFVAAMSGSIVGAWIGSRLSVERRPPSVPLRWGAVAGAIGIALVVGLGLPKPVTQDVRASIQLTDVTAPADSPAAGGRAVNAVVTLDPPNAAEHAKWFTLMAWQGGGLVVDRLEEIGPGQYKSTQAIPVHGTWKSMVRLHTGRALMAVPVYLPADAALKAPEIPATPQIDRTFIADHTLLQREQKPANAVLTVIAYLVVVAIALALITLLVWGLHRLGLPPKRRPQPESDAATDAAAAGSPTPRSGGATGRPSTA